MKERLRELIEKVLSFKFLMFAITSIFRIKGYIGNPEWITVTMTVICGHIGMKGVHTVMDKKGECGD